MTGTREDSVSGPRTAGERRTPESTLAEAARNELRLFVAAEIQIARNNRKAPIDWKGFEKRLGAVVDTALAEAANA